MKNTEAKRQLKYLLIIVPALLCVAVVLLLLFLPKEDAPSPQPTAQSKKTETVEHSLIYSAEYTSYDISPSTPKKNENLTNRYLKDVLSKYEGQDVYFRVIARPVLVQEEIADTEDKSAKFEEILKTRLEYIKDVGAKDIVTDGNLYCITVNAQMIQKIGDAGGWHLDLASIPRPDGYNEKITDSLAYFLEDMEDNDTQTVKVSINNSSKDTSEIRRHIQQLISQNNIKDEQITNIQYYEATSNFIATLTKVQIMSLDINDDVTEISPIIENNVIISK